MTGQLYLSCSHGRVRRRITPPVADRSTDDYWGDTGRRVKPRKVGDDMRVAPALSTV